jgi:hypothetical protein
MQQTFITTIVSTQLTRFSREEGGTGTSSDQLARMEYVSSHLNLRVNAFGRLRQAVAMSEKLVTIMS